MKNSKSKVIEEPMVKSVYAELDEILTSQLKRIADYVKKTRDSIQEDVAKIAEIKKDIQKQSIELSKIGNILISVSKKLNFTGNTVLELADDAEALDTGIEVSDIMTYDEAIVETQEALAEECRNCKHFYVETDADKSAEPEETEE